MLVKGAPGALPEPILINIDIDCLLVQNWDNYHKTSDISRTLVGKEIVDNSDVVGASPVGAAPTTSSFST